MYYVSTEKCELVSIEELSNDIANLVKSNILNSCYPKGSIYMSMDSTSPSTLFGGTWQALDEGRVLIGCNDSYPAKSTGGEFTHTLTTAEMPSHTHTMDIAGEHTHSYKSQTWNDVVDAGGQQNAADNSWSTYQTGSAGEHIHTINSTGDGSAHNNMQPYLAVYMWQRIS